MGPQGAQVWLPSPHTGDPRVCEYGAHESARGMREACDAAVADCTAQSLAPLRCRRALCGVRWHPLCGALLRGACAATLHDAEAAAVCGCCAAGGERERRALPLPEAA